MPFKSKAQQRFMYSQKPEGVDLKEWSDSTDFKHLPEKAKTAKKHAALDYFAMKHAGALGTLAGAALGAGVGGYLGGMGDHTSSVDHNAGTDFSTPSHDSVPERMLADNGHLSTGNMIGMGVGGTAGAGIGDAMTTPDSKEDIERERALRSWYDANHPKTAALDYFAMKHAEKLTAEARKAIPKGQFALPGRRYPIENESHARNALARASGKSVEGAVRAAVHAKYPNIK